MARPAKLTDDMIQAAREIVQECRTARELRTGLSVLIPKVCCVANSQAADVLGLGVATVVRMQKRIRDQVGGKKKEKGGWGGRRRETLTVEEEKEFLAPWVEKATVGGVLVVPPIHAALEERLGHSVAKSTVYRLLARHGWRKVEPDTCHPKRDEQAQEAFKKNSRKRWQKLPPATR
jgi:transposase